MATGWQIALDEFKAGRGGYYVPDPSPTAECGSLIAIRDQQIAHRNDVKGRLKDFKKASSLNPMREIISMLEANISKYQSAYDSCLSRPVITPQPAPADIPATSVPTAPVNVNNDPILQTATPTGSGAPSTGNGPGTQQESPDASPAATTGAGFTPGSSQATGAGTTANTGTGASTATGQGSGSPAAKVAAKVTTAAKKVPKWAWWVGAAIVLGTIAVVVFKGKGKKVANG
jgi:hypothetical protein